MRKDLTNPVYNLDLDVYMQSSKIILKMKKKMFKAKGDEFDFC